MSIDPNPVLSQLKAAVPEEAKPFVRFVLPDKVCRDYDPVCAALTTAINAIFPKLRNPVPLTMIIGVAPFVTHGIYRGTWTFAPPNQVVGVATDNTIYLKCGMLANIAEHEVRVAFILEELAHVWLNIADEELVGEVVQRLFPAVTVTHQHDPAGVWQSKEYRRA